MFKVEVHKADAWLRSSEVLTSGSSKDYKATFSFIHPIWNGLTKKAVFKAGSVVKEQLLADSLSCEIPWEVLQTPGAKLEVGVYGVDGTGVVIPTVWVKAGVIKKGTVEGEESKEPTPDIYDQIVGSIGPLDQLTTEHKENLVEAINEVKEIADAGGSGGGDQGTIDHSKLINRDIADQHPMKAVTGLENALQQTISVDKLGDTMKVDEFGKIGVKTTDDMEQDNTLPITSSAVYTTVGNIQALLDTI